MEKKSISSFLLNTVKSLIISIESEIKIMDKQLVSLKSAPGITKNDQIQLSLQRNIKSALHDLLALYHRSMEQVTPPIAPLNQVISCHIYTLQQDNFQILLHELYGQQSALTTLVGKEYKKCTNDSDLPTDIHLKMIFLVFPWEFVIDLLSNSNFLTTYLKTVLNYNPSKHESAVTTIFNCVQKFQTLPILASKIHFFTAQAPMYFALSELLVTIFTHNVMMKVNWNPLLNFSIAEKCALIAQRGIEICELNKELMKTIRDASAKKLETNQSVDDFAYLRPIESIQQSSSDSEEENEYIEIPELMHVVLELRKIEFKHSPSEMLFCLSNALQYLTASLAVDGAQIGTDESFQFFAFCLSNAKLSCLPAIVAFIDKFINDALHETKYDYYIEHLRSGFEFIDNRLLPVQPFILFPFANPPKHLKNIIKRAETSVQVKGQINKKADCKQSNQQNSSFQPNDQNSSVQSNDQNSSAQSNEQNSSSQSTEQNSSTQSATKKGGASKTVNAKPSGEIIMKGFDIYAFPTWTIEYSTLFPSMIRYNGNQNYAICYQYTVTSIPEMKEFNEKFEAIPTLHGTFFQLKEDLIKSANMIKVEHEDYEKKEEEVEVFSALMLMGRKTMLINPKLSLLDQSFTLVRKEWRFRFDDPIVAVKTTVAEVQKALLLLNLLPESFPIDGVLNNATIDALRQFIKKRKLIITPNLFKAIVSSAK